MQREIPEIFCLFLPKIVTERQHYRHGSAFRLPISRMLRKSRMVRIRTLFL